MKTALVLAISLLVNAALAQVTLQVIPASPLITMTDHKADMGDGNLMNVPGPWFQTTLLVINSGREDVFLDTQTMTLKMANGLTQSSSQPLDMGAPLPAGQVMQLMGYYSLMGLTDFNNIQGEMGITGTSISGQPFSATATFSPSL